MTHQAPTRKIYFGVTDRRQMFRLFDRHAQRPDRSDSDGSHLYAGEYFEIGHAEHDYMVRPEKQLEALDCRDSQGV